MITNIFNISTVFPGKQVSVRLNRTSEHVITNIFNISSMFPGKPVSFRLNRSQIDKASKDKSSKFSENFNVTFFYDVASEHVITNIFNKANSFSSDTCYVPWKAS